MLGRTLLKAARVVAIRRSSTLVANNGVVSSPFRDIQLSELPYYDYMFENVGFHGQRTALVNSITEETLTFDHLMNKSRDFGHAIQAIPDCKVLGILLPNCVEYPIVFCGCAKAKVITTTINPAYTPNEISKQLKLSGCSHVVTSSQFYPAVQEAAKQLGCPIQAIITDKKIDGCLDLEEMIKGAKPMQQVDIEVHNDIITLPFSSGTTGTPKGVMLTHFNLVTNIVQLLDTHPQQALMDESTDLHQNVLFCVLPLYHIYAMNVAMGAALKSGAKLIMLPKFDPGLFISALTKYQPTHLNLAPPLVSFLVNSPAVERKHLDSVQDLIVAAAPTGPALFEKFKAKFPQTVMREAWGMTELSPAGTVTPKNNVKPGSSGPAVPNASFKVIDIESGKALGPGKTGELCFAGPMVMKGYLNNQEATDHTIKKGWLHSGDIAYYDNDGYIHIVDRIKELIKVKGFQVPPAEIEDLLRTMQGVKDVAVIGVPHEKFGEAPRAYVVRQEAGADNLTEEDVKDYVAKNLTSYKQLAGGVEFLDIIPKSAAGKILRRVLVDNFQKQNAL